MSKKPPPTLLDLRDPVPDFANEVDEFRWQEKAIQSIAVGEPQWDEVQPHSDSDAMKAVRKLREEYETAMMDPRRDFRDIDVGDQGMADMVRISGMRAIESLWDEAKFHRKRHDHNHRITTLKILFEIGARYTLGKADEKPAPEMPPAEPDPEDMKGLSDEEIAERAGRKK